MAGKDAVVEIAANDASPTAVSDIGPSSIDFNVSHAVEDILLGVLVVSLALDDRIGTRMVRDVVRVFLRARQDGRERELLAAARQEAGLLPEWQCNSCRESNPGTFDICWQCRHPQSPGLPRLRVRSEIILAIDSTTKLKSERAPESRESHGFQSQTESEGEPGLLHNPK